MNQLTALSKAMNINFNKNIFTETGPKNRELANLLKEKLISYLCKIINEENQPEGFNVESGSTIDDALQPISHP